MSKIETGLGVEIYEEKVKRDNKRVSTVENPQKKLKLIGSDLSQRFQVLKYWVLSKLTLGRGRDELASLEELRMSRSYSSASSARERRPKDQLEEIRRKIYEDIYDTHEELREEIEEIKTELLEKQGQTEKNIKTMDENLDKRLQVMEQRMRSIERSLKIIIENQEFEREAAQKLMGLKIPPKKKY